MTSTQNNGASLLGEDGMISVEANIGSGKSTFLRLLKEKYPEKFNVIYEPLDGHTPSNPMHLSPGFRNTLQRETQQSLISANGVYFLTITSSQKC
jgi:hypothetical protein